MTTPEFVSGIELNRGFYRDVVQPLVGEFDHAAALLGTGSDVLGYDTARSTDHGWGPRLQLFVAASDVSALRQLLDKELPRTYAGWPVRYGWATQYSDDVQTQHHVGVWSTGEWLRGHLGVDPRDGLSTADWLSIPQQLIFGVVRGAVFADPHGELAKVRDYLTWYPREVWLWLLASQWRRISEEEAFTGRAAEVGDELGSRVIAARLVRELMRLAFLQAQSYWPYTKWFGTAFAELPGAAELMPSLEAALAATDYLSREDALVGAYELLARRHNDAALTAYVDPSVRNYYDRPFRVLFAERFAQACRDAIADPTLRELPLVGSVEQFVDSTDVLSSADRPQQLRSLFGQHSSAS